MITSFSTLYLRVYYDGAPEPTETETEPTETTPPSTTVTSPATSPTTPTPPKTGELPNASFWYALAMLALATVAIIVKRLAFSKDAK